VSSPSRPRASEADREYDRFGPWVIEISPEDPPPPLFLPYLDRADVPLLSLKVPRRISRREAHPGMDLYDFVVSAHEDDMVILQRTQGGVEHRTVSYRDIRLVSLSTDLLRGTLHLGLPEESLELPFNTVSEALMRRLVDIVRARYGPAHPAHRALPREAVTEGLSFYFEGLLDSMRQAGSDMRPVAVQPQVPLGSLDSTRLHRLVFGLVDKRLLESLHLTDGRELLVIDRGRAFAYRWHSVYGRVETWLPLAGITAARLEGDATGPLVTLVVSTPGGERRWVFRQDVPGLAAYREFLAKAG